MVTHVGELCKNKKHTLAILQLAIFYKKMVVLHIAQLLKNVNLLHSHLCIVSYFSILIQLFFY